MVIEILGKDIGGLVVSYWPQFEWDKLLKQIEIHAYDYNVPLLDLPEDCVDQ